MPRLKIHYVEKYKFYQLLTFVSDKQFDLDEPEAIIDFTLPQLLELKKSVDDEIQKEVMRTLDKIGVKNPYKD